MNIKALLDPPLMQRQPGHTARSCRLRDMIMSPKTLVFLAVVLVAGVLGGTAAYRIGVLAGRPEPAPRESLIVDSTDQVAEKPKARNGRPAFAPCRKPAKLEGGKCVTDVVRNVTVPGSSVVAAAPAPAPAPAAPAPATPPGGSEQSHHHSHDDGDDHGHHSGEGEDGHHHGGDDDNHDDDDHDDDDHDDDDHSGHGHGGDDD
jgi:hypothetical protein